MHQRFHTTAILAATFGTTITSAQICDGVLAPGAGPVPPADTSDPWAAPASYYAGATGTGGTLKNQLASAMTSGHIQRAYGDFRFSAAAHDADPSSGGQILLVYNRASVPATWNSGTTWNREHVWPQSRQPGSASNSSRGNLGDPHALRPANPGINGARGNRPFGFASTTGSFGSVSSSYFPGDADKGDIARSLFYSATRWASNGLSLTNGFPSGNQMGDLASLVAWHYLDVPDAFERRRNHVIFSSALNPTYFTNNRSAFVDIPGAVWSVFVDNFNDSQLWVGSNPSANGGSSAEFCVRAIETVPPPAFEVMLNRGGNDGTYYAVEASGDAVSDQPFHNGFTGAFAINDTAPRTLLVGIDPLAVTGPGFYSGTVTITNLDRTTGVGNGFGSRDADDHVTVDLEAVAPSSASFMPGSSVTTLDLDLGRVFVGNAAETTFPVYALDPGSGFTAGVQFALNEAFAAPQPAEVSIPAGVVQPGGSGLAAVQFTPSSAGELDLTLVIDTMDDPSVFGAAARDPLVVNLTIAVRDEDINGDGALNQLDIRAFFEAVEANDPFADLDANGLTDSFDIARFLEQFAAAAAN
ncbi:MAG: endonuclease [Planctomycetota bacterium]